jgi:hypothetical protein
MSKESNLVVLKGGKKSSFGISEMIQTGILFTLLTLAYNLGQVIQKFDMRVEVLEKSDIEQIARITKLEQDLRKWP